MAESLSPKTPTDETPRDPDYRTGTGKEVNRARGELSLPAEKVDNEVLWVNPAFRSPSGDINYLPFRLEPRQLFKRGEPTDLAVFLSRQGTRRLAINPESGRGRSGLLGRIILRDRERITYRDVDAKGTGHFRARRWSADDGPSHHIDEVTTEGAAPSPHQILGIVDEGYAHTDIDNSERLIGLGIRTCRIVALIRLKELVYRDEKISIEEAKRRGIIPGDARPVIEIRAYRGTRERVDSVSVPLLGTSSLKSRKRTEAVIKDAKALVAQELGKDPDEFSDNDYLEWFAKTLGENLAKLHNAGYFHGYVSEHNVTLDGCIVDLDSVDTMANIIARRNREGGGYYKKYQKGDLCREEISDACATLENLVLVCATLENLVTEYEGTRAETAIKDQSHYQSLLREAYTQRLNPKLRKAFAA